MRSLLPIAAVALLVCGCDRGEEVPPPAPEAGAEAPAPSSPESNAADRSAARWDLRSSGEGIALALLSGQEETTVRLLCASGENRLLVNVPAFRPIASEERLSFGSGGDAVALVADARGDRQRGGVSGTGEIPANLDRLVGEPFSVSYGAQTSGPHRPPPAALSRAFVAACGGEPVASNGGPASEEASTNPCLVQGSETLRVAPLRAVGTEPFWGARVEGRCVTYSHPEDQQGTRVWTRYTAVPGGGRWSGALRGRSFELRTRAEPGCSDGMSDKRYPIAVDLMVDGEQRRGCAEPI